MQGPQQPPQEPHQRRVDLDSTPVRPKHLKAVGIARGTRLILAGIQCEIVHVSDLPLRIVIKPIGIVSFDSGPIHPAAGIANTTVEEPTT